MNHDQQQQKIEPTEQQKKDGNLDPITDASGSHPVGTGVGALAGGAAGIAGGIAASAATGAATGTLLGGPVGAVAGLVVGAVAGGLAGKAVAEQIDPTLDDAYWRENHSKQPYSKAGDTFETYAPAYRTGYDGYGRYSGKSFEEAQADLQKDYERNKGDSNLSWEGAKDAVRSAWNRLSGSNTEPQRKG